MKTKRLLMLIGSICLSLVLAALLLPACAPAAPEEVAEEIAALEAEIDDLEGDVAAEKVKVADLEDEVAALRAPVEVLEWRFQHWRIPAEPAMIYYKDMLENKIPELTDGRLKIKLYYGGEIVKMPDLIEALGTGVLEISGAPPYYLRGTIPEAGIDYGLPYGIRTPLEMYNFMYGVDLPPYFGGWRAVDFHREVYAEHNVYYLCGGIDCWPASFMFTTPITSLDDIKGKKVRGSGLMNDWIDKVGGEGVYIPGEELYSALATGVVDGVSWGSGMGMYSMLFHEVCKYFLYPPLMPVNHGAMFVSMDHWNALPDDMKGILETAFIKLGLDFVAHQNWTGETWAINTMIKEHGITLCELTGDDLKRAEEAAFEIWDEQAAISPRCGRYVEMVRDYMRTLGYID